MRLLDTRRYTHRSGFTLGLKGRRSSMVVLTNAVAAGVAPIPLDSEYIARELSLAMMPLMIAPVVLARALSLLPLATEGAIHTIIHGVRFQPNKNSI